MSANFRKGLTALAGTAMAVLFVGGLLFLVLSIDTGAGGDGGPQAVATTLPDADETPLPPDSSSAEGSDRTAASYGGLQPEQQPDMVPLPPMGIATADFEWTISDVMDSAGGEVWLNQLLQFDGTLWAIGGGFDPDTESEYSVVFTSGNGITWERKNLPEGLSGAGNATFTATDFGMVATVNVWDEETRRAQLRGFVSADGDTWTETDLSSFVGADENLWVSWLAGGDGVLMAAGAKETVPAGDWGPTIITIERDGYIIELDEGQWTYTLTDAATGAVVAEGSQEIIWASQGDSTGIYDPVAGEVIFPIGWEALDQAGVAAYEGAQWGAPLAITLTSGDRTLTLDEFSGEVTVTDGAGAVLFTGTEQDLWQGPPPTFTDPATGDVIVVVPWDEWNAAHEAAYPESVGAYSATPVLLRSADGGATWVAVDIESIAGDGFMFQSLQRGPAGFLAVGVIDDYAFEAALSSVDALAPPAPIVLASPDGLAWTELATDLDDGAWLQGISATADGYMAILSDETGSRVVTSADGASWQTVLSTADLGLELGNVWFERIAAGALGTFITGTYDGYTEPAPPAPATISKDGRTLTIDMTNYTVTDDATGAVLFTFDESRYWAEGEATAAQPTGFKWGQGGIVMFDDAGGVLFAASHREFEEAMQEVSPDPGVYYESEPVLLYSDGGAWVRALLPAELGPHAWFGGMVATDSSVVLTATSEAEAGLEGLAVSTKALVGVPAN